MIWIKTFLQVNVHRDSLICTFHSTNICYISLIVYRVSFCPLFLLCIKLFVMVIMDESARRYGCLVCWIELHKLFLTAVWCCLDWFLCVHFSSFLILNLNLNFLYWWYIICKNYELIANKICPYLFYNKRHISLNIIFFIFFWQ